MIREDYILNTLFWYALNYINELGRKFDYVKKVDLTGYEMEGLTIEDNTWCYFNLEKDRKLMIRNSGSSNFRGPKEKFSSNFKN